MRIRSWPVLRAASAVSLATAILIPVALDLLSAQASDVTRRVFIALAVLTVGAVSAPWTSLTIDHGRGVLHWRRVRFLSRSSIHGDFDDVTGAALVRWPNLGMVSGRQIVVHTRQSNFTIPLAWAWREGNPRDVIDAFEAVQAELRTPDARTALPPVTRQRKLFQVSLRRVLVATALSAAVLGLSKWHFWSAVNAEGPATLLAAIIAAAAAILYRPGSVLTERFLLAPIVMYGPLLWIVAEQWPFGRTSGLYDGALMFPAIWVALLPFVNGPDGIFWPSAACVLLELAISLEFARRGWKWTIPWTLLLFVISAIGSFGLNAAIRA
ncbi:MAG: hypothetical protein SGJ19_10925 [Planctomycetia bacterium]|nr:hypothetical protein [Planctomycetia bacterium]